MLVLIILKVLVKSYAYPYQHLCILSAYPMSSDIFVTFALFLMYFLCLIGQLCCWGAVYSGVLEESPQQSSKGQEWPRSGNCYTEQVKIKLMWR